MLRRNIKWFKISVFNERGFLKSLWIFLFSLIVVTAQAQDKNRSGLFAKINEIATEFSESYLSTLTLEEKASRVNSVTRFHGYVLDDEIVFKKENEDMDEQASKNYHQSDMKRVGYIPFQIEFGTKGTVISAAVAGGYNMIDAKKGSGINNISYMKVRYLDMDNLDVVDLKLFEFEMIPVNFLKENGKERFGPVVDFSLGTSRFSHKGSNPMTAFEEAISAYQDGFSLVSGLGLSYNKKNKTSLLQSEVKYKFYNYTNSDQLNYFSNRTDYQHDVNVRLNFVKKLKSKQSLNLFVESSFLLNGKGHLQEITNPTSVQLPRQRAGFRYEF